MTSNYYILGWIKPPKSPKNPHYLNIAGIIGSNSVPKKKHNANCSDWSQGPFCTKNGQLELQIERIHIHDMRKDHLSVLPNEKGDKSDKSAIFS